ncbi:hypothetical protein Droror1_Dr00021101 [Drosera rotundifolia]
MSVGDPIAVTVEDLNEIEAVGTPFGSSKGTLRVMLVLLHDFPEFLCDYHFSFCDVIPASYIQMWNIILSAFTQNMRLPDPSTPNLKIGLYQEMAQPPLILSEVDAALTAKHMKADVEAAQDTATGFFFPQ